MLVARQPHAEADLLLTEGDALAVAVRIFGPVLVHYRVDHAVSLVHILDFEIIGADDGG